MNDEPSNLPPVLDPDKARERPGPLSAGPNPLEIKSRRRRSAARRALHSLLVLIGHALFRLLWSTYRLQVVAGDEHLATYDADEEPYVLTFWHDQAFGCFSWFQLRAQRRTPPLVLVSPSLDGDPIARLVEKMGGRVVRGSATRSAIKSLRALYRSMRTETACPIILPDGPRGPSHVCKPGALMLAQLAGCPVLPMACSIRWAWRAPTWDRGILPLPFARIKLAVGEPRIVSADANSSQLESQSLELGLKLDELTALAAEA